MVDRNVADHCESGPSGVTAQSNARISSAHEPTRFCKPGVVHVAAADSPG
jgi:hypothetical protein